MRAMNRIRKLEDNIKVDIIRTIRDNPHASDLMIARLYRTKDGIGGVTPTVVSKLRYY